MLDPMVTDKLRYHFMVQPLKLIHKTNLKCIKCRIQSQSHISQNLHYECVDSCTYCGVALPSAVVVIACCVEKVEYLQWRTVLVFSCCIETKQCLLVSNKECIILLQMCLDYTQNAQNVNDYAFLTALG